MIFLTKAPSFIVEDGWDYDGEIPVFEAGGVIYTPKDCIVVVDEEDVELLKKQLTNNHKQMSNKAQIKENIEKHLLEATAKKELELVDFESLQIAAQTLHILEGAKKQ